YEIDKVLTAFDYYIANAETILAAKVVKSNASKSYIAFEPLGVIFSIMPWNFPFWQVFRFAVPSLMAGNVTVLKHAPNVPQCAEAIAKLFAEADIPKSLLLTYFLSNEDAAKVIADSRIAGVSFTGSDTAGAIIAGLAGANLKKAVVELGGNDAFIVLDDADLDYAISEAIRSRSINSGQSCNAAKRFIVTEKNYDEFLQKLIEKVRALKVGNPTEPDTQVGPLARKDLAEKVRKQISDTVAEGAKVFANNDILFTSENFVAPTVLANATSTMTAFNEEIFGPVWSVIKANDVQHAIELANATQFGLGASIWTRDIAFAETLVPEIQSGNVFINDIVKSDARLPFGGIKRSGFGRELSEFGMLEFVNVKTVYIH
ncbi:MAG TPA: aldehyde dehydrogenase family protein, partial [Chitinophagales bacterium]